MLFVQNSNLEDGLDCPFEEDDIVEEEEYDALNDETFGSEAAIGDWEKDHEKLAEITESTRPHHQNALSKKVCLIIIIEQAMFKQYSSRNYNDFACNEQCLRNKNNYCRMELTQISRIIYPTWCWTTRKVSYHVPEYGIALPTCHRLNYDHR